MRPCVCGHPGIAHHQIVERAPYTRDVIALETTCVEGCPCSEFLVDEYVPPTASTRRLPKGAHP